MSDDLDQAQEVEELGRRMALAPILQTAAAQAYPAGLFQCWDCLDPIPLERLAAVPGARRCAHCQGLAETRPRRSVR